MLYVLFKDQPSYGRRIDPMNRIGKCRWYLFQWTTAIIMYQICHATQGLVYNNHKTKHNWNKSRWRSLRSSVYFKTPSKKERQERRQRYVVTASNDIQTHLSLMAAFRSQTTINARSTSSSQQRKTDKQTQTKCAAYSCTLREIWKADVDKGENM